MMKMYRQFEKDRDVGNFSTLPELHALSSGLKAVCTWITADGIEACRRCCGGHGYSLLSGLPTLFASYVQNVTWEGDNNVMCLQVGVCGCRLSSCFLVMDNGTVTALTTLPAGCVSSAAMRMRENYDDIWFRKTHKKPHTKNYKHTNDGSPHTLPRLLATWSRLCWPHVATAPPLLEAPLTWHRSWPGGSARPPPRQIGSMWTCR